MLEMRTSERSSLKRCAQQWYWSTVEGLAPKRAANPLWFGSAVHEGLADWYLPGLERGPHPAETFSKFLDGERSMLVTNEDEEIQYVDARALGISMLEGYVDLYAKDDKWEVIATEQTFQVLLKRPAIRLFSVDYPEQSKWLRYVGTWDGVYRDLETGEIWLMEHKTAAGIRVDHLPLDDQAGSYWAFATIILRKMGILGPTEELAGIMYNFLRKALPDLRPRNEDNLYTNKPLKQHYVDALLNWYGEDSATEEMEAWAVDLPKMKILDLEDLVAQQKGLQVFGEVSKLQPPAFYERWPVYRSRGERKTMIRRIQNEAIFSEAYREGWLPITKSPTKDCSWCPFNRMCQLDEQGDQEAVEEYKADQYITRNPYEAHIKKSAE